MPKRPWAPAGPSRNPVITSSNTSSAPCSVQRRRQVLEEAGVGRDEAHVGGDRLDEHRRERRRRWPANAASSAATSLYGTTIVSATVPGGDAGRARAGRASRRRCRRRRAARRGGRGSSRRTSGSSSRPVAPRARRTAVIAASVPDDTSRTFSTAAPAPRSPRRARPRASVGAPYDVPSAAARCTASTIAGCGVAEDRRAPRLHVVEVAVARRCRRGTRRRPASTKNGSPPTAPNARTGEFTPPGMRAERALEQLVRRSLGHAHEQALGDLAREVGEDEVGAGALDREQVLERDRGAVDPAVARRRPSPSRTRRSRGTPRPGRRTRCAPRRSRRGTASAGFTITMSAPSLDVERRPRRAPRGRCAGSIW